MARIHIGGAGGAPSNNFIRSMRDSTREHYLIGASSVPSDLMLADVDEKHVVPNATAPGYGSEHSRACWRARARSFMHVQSDYEVLAVSRIRDEIQSLGIRLFLPSPQTVEDCVDKGKSYRIWAARWPAGATHDSSRTRQTISSRLSRRSATRSGSAPR